MPHNFMAITCLFPSLYQSLTLSGAVRVPRMLISHALGIPKQQIIRVIYIPPFCQYTCTFLTIRREQVTNTRTIFSPNVEFHAQY